jgi:hypothetical protein
MNTETDCEAALPHNDGAKAERIDLGLAVLSAVAPPRAAYTTAEIAAYCGCTKAMITAIEARALRRLREKTRAQFKLSPLDTDERLRFLALHLPS